MATTATTVINDVLSRVRDPVANLASTVQPPTTASGRAFILTLINHCSIFVAVGERLLIGTSDLIVSPDSPIYDLLLSGPTDYGGIVTSAFIAGTGEIDGPVDYKALGRTSRTWLTDTGPKPLAWAPIGNTLLALYPISTVAALNVTLRYAQAPPFLANEATTLALPDYATGHLARLVSLVESIKAQQLTDFNNRLQQLAQDMGVMELMHMTGGKAD